jgi:hypothetical protein
MYLQSFAGRRHRREQAPHPHSIRRRLPDIPGGNLVRQAYPSRVDTLQTARDPHTPRAIPSSCRTRTRCCSQWSTVPASLVYDGILSTGGTAPRLLSYLEGPWSRSWRHGNFVRSGFLFAAGTGCNGSGRPTFPDPFSSSIEHRSYTPSGTISPTTRWLGRIGADNAGTGTLPAGATGTRCAPYRCRQHRFYKVGYSFQAGARAPDGNGLCSTAGILSHPPSN